jgi:transcriptional regulator with XRE-family HTH domain
MPVRRSKQAILPIDRHLAACIRFYRERCGMDARTLDRAARLLPGSVSKLERGEKTLKLPQLLALSEALGLDMDRFFEGAPEIRRVDDLKACPCIPVSEAEELIRAFIAMPNPQSRKEFSALVRSVADSRALKLRSVKIFEKPAP